MWKEIEANGPIPEAEDPLAQPIQTVVTEPNPGLDQSYAVSFQALEEAEGFVGSLKANSMEDAQRRAKEIADAAWPEFGLALRVAIQNRKTGAKSVLIQDGE